MSPEATTNIIFGIIMILLGILEMFLVERIFSRHHHRLTDLERQFLPMQALTTTLSIKIPHTSKGTLAPSENSVSSTIAPSDDTAVDDREEDLYKAAEEEMSKAN